MSLLLLLEDRAAIDALSPSVQDIALLEHTRTVGPGGAEVGTFNEDTRPTAAQVTELIALALQAVLGQLHEGFNETHYDRARPLVALQTAIMIEGSFFRQNPDEAAVALYTDMLANGITALNAIVDRDRDENVAAPGRGSAVVESMIPVYDGTDPLPLEIAWPLP
jgi:hypothetical protein